MDYNELLEAALKAVYMLRDENARIPLSDLYAHLRERGKNSLFADDTGDLRGALESDELKDFFRIEYEEDELGHRHYFISLSEEGEEKAVAVNAEKFRNPQTLFSWGFMGRYTERIDQLAELALPEDWDEPGKPNGVLHSYVAITFQRLLQERKGGNQLAIVETEKWAAFNTGLVDRLYDPIFALFSLNKRKGMQKWIFHSWCTPGNKRAGQILSRFFYHLPRRASYFQKPSEYLYDEYCGIPTLPFDHIMDRLSRLPVSFLRRFAPDGFDFPADSDFKPDSQFIEAYRQALLDDDLARLHFKDALELSLRRAIKRVAWNYRIAIPVYDSKRRKMMLLIPMSLDFQNFNHVDVALVVERTKISNKYIGHTILTLGMAYRKARMVMRQEADWLNLSMLEADRDTENLSSDDEEQQLAIEISESNATAVAVDIANRAREEVEAGEAENAQKAEFHNQHDNDVIFRPEIELNQPKIVGSIDLDVLADRSSRYGIKTTPDQTEQEEMLTTDIAGEEETAAEEEAARFMPPTAPDPEDYTMPRDRDYDIRGVYREGYGQSYVQVGKLRFQARQFTDSGFIDDDEVLFDLGSEPNLKGTGTFRYAINIRYPED